MMNRQKLNDYFFTGTQFLLFIAYLFYIQIGTITIPFWLSYLGIILAISGVILSALALIQIRKSLSPFPSPLPEAKLITHGVFKSIRHPIYSGIILAGIGYALYSSSLYRLLITILLYVLFYFKSSYEEKLLMQKFPEYQEYQKNTGRFWPFI